MARDAIEILFVEDEVMIRLGAVGSFEDLGFTVHEASNYAEAMAILAEHNLIRAMFTDIDMPPGANGLQLATEVRQRWPAIKIIVTSGKVALLDSDLPFVGEFVGKPYESEKVAESLRRMVLAAT